MLWKLAILFCLIGFFSYNLCGDNSITIGKGILLINKYSEQHHHIFYEGLQMRLYYHVLNNQTIYNYKYESSKHPN